MKNIHLIEGDITKAKADAIVNAANPMMLGGGGVDGAIHKAAGPKLLEECRKVKAERGIRCPFGDARITPSGNLPSTFVSHTAGPIYRKDVNPVKTLESSYINSLNLAISNNCKSIAFPAISCGVYGYPLEEAAQIALEVCCECQYNKLEIYFYLFGKAIFSAWQNELEKTKKG